MPCRRRIATGDVAGARLETEERDRRFQDGDTAAGEGVLGVSVQVSPAQVQGVRHGGGVVVGGAQQFEGEREPVVLR